MKRLFSLLLALALLCAVLPASAAKNDPVPVTGISLSKPPVLVPLGKETSLKIVVNPKKATDKRVTWSSSDESVATVKNGRVYGVSVGTAVITAEALDGSGVSASVEVTVLIPVKKITLCREKSLPLASMVSWQLPAEVTPADATHPEIVWSSSNEKVATVNRNGVVTGIAPGRAKITATASDGTGVSESVTFLVSDYDLVFTDRNIKALTYFYGKGTFRIRGSVANGCVQIPNVDKTVTAETDGLHEEGAGVVPVKPGEDRITINVGGKLFTYTVFVSPEAFPGSEGSVTAKQTDEDGGVLFLDLPWGTSYNDAAKLLGAQGVTLKPFMKYDTYLRAMVEGETSFSMLTAFRAGLNFSYDPSDRRFQKNNALFKGDLYFDPEIPFERIQLAVRNEYGLDKGTESGDACTWQVGDTRLILQKKERFTILEIIRTGGDGE